jgi:hypothetical protein
LAACFYVAGVKTFCQVTRKSSCAISAEIIAKLLRLINGGHAALKAKGSKSQPQFRQVFRIGGPTYPLSEHPDEGQISLRLFGGLVKAVAANICYQNHEKQPA